MFYLREVRMEDKEDIFTFSQREIVTEFLSWKPHQSINETEWVIKNLYLSKNKNGLPNSYAICLNNNNKVIGIIDFHYDEEQRLSIGYFLNNDYWHQGIMTNALGQMIDIAFKELKFNEIYIAHEQGNIGSKKVIIKNGFKYFETKKIYYPNKNKEVLIDYYIKRNDSNDK